jgi:hypothetical protein
VGPHRVWLRFLSERYEAVRARNDQTDLFARLLFKSLENPLLLNALPASFGARFQLLTFAFKFLSSAGQSPQLCFAESAMREYFYAAALGWFAEEPAYALSCRSSPFSSYLIDLCGQEPFLAKLILRSRWYDAGSRQQNIDDIKSLIEFTKLIDADSFLRNQPSIVAAMTRSPTEALLSPRTGTAKIDKKKDKERKVRSGVPEELQSQEPEEKKRVRQLLLLLLANELDRLTSWHNPLNRVTLMLPDQNIFFDRVNAVKSWREIVVTAWEFSPRLAVRLAERLPRERLRFELEALVRIPSLLSFRLCSVPLLIPVVRYVNIQRRL